MHEDPTAADPLSEGPPLDAPGPRPWPRDMAAFTEELSALGSHLRLEMGEADLEHMHMIQRWGRVCTALGYGTAWLAPNPVSALLISTGRFARWTMIGHHVGHRGYDKVGGPLGREFAEGHRRWQWLDWLLPAAWKHEHNQLHHYRLNEARDPDLVEENLSWLRDSDWPMWKRYLLVGFFMMTWKWTYYAPNTIAELLRGDVPEEDLQRNVYSFDPRTKAGRTLWLKSYLPYGGVFFVLLPLLFLPLGLWAAFSVLVNSLMAEALTNIHSFMVIVPNHAGGDLYRFDQPGKGRGVFYLRQVLGSADFRTGGDLNDFLHGFLNYQIEHHLWPDLSMLAYQKAQPHVVAICRKHGVPYVQESIFERVRRTIRVMVGAETMKRWEEEAAGPDEAAAA